jgi:hypothetical protein
MPGKMAGETDVYHLCARQGDGREPGGGALGDKVAIDPPDRC